jgi:hypothetical protein
MTTSDSVRPPIVIHDSVVAGDATGGPPTTLTDIAESLERLGVAELAYVTVTYVDGGIRIMGEARAGTLDAAWQKAEAALPMDWRIDGLWVAGSGWEARATQWDSGADRSGTGDTPTAALRSLAARLPGVSDE